jgi:hypothetical protein
MITAWVFWRTSVSPLKVVSAQPPSKIWARRLAVHLNDFVHMKDASLVLLELGRLMLLELGGLLFVPSADGADYQHAQITKSQAIFPRLVKTTPKLLLMIPFVSDAKYQFVQHRKLASHAET